MRDDVLEIIGTFRICGLQYGLYTAYLSWPIPCVQALRTHHIIFHVDSGTAHEDDALSADLVSSSWAVDVGDTVTHAQYVFCDVIPVDIHVAKVLAKHPWSLHLNILGIGSFFECVHTFMCGYVCVCVLITFTCVCIFFFIFFTCIHVFISCFNWSSTPLINVAVGILRKTLS